MIYLLFIASLATAQECPHKLVDGKKICLTQAEIDEMSARAVSDANRIAAEKAKDAAVAARRTRIKNGCNGATGLLKDICDEVSGQ